ncbi:riboflavin-binding protein-like isoform X1 [Bufo bufo]|uniref:riboflavin-binding protein-like isoform X1 n=1 Tax=Bufo bufo TaxID=8384 RepID=UPI001ABE064F|nr:riboflavin-binding protein-like isoform X1 [Bufo bufo]XP_040263297.1 riboflavin-binding protein-like isoform X1 [Bufo bufo]
MTPDTITKCKEDKESKQTEDYKLWGLRPADNPHCKLRINMKAVIILVALSFLSAVLCHHGGCLHGKYHKVAPGPEPNMQECQLYSKSACCPANFTEKLSASPLIQVDNHYWNRCGNLSKMCEAYMKKVECFYQCSPDTHHWMNPNISSAMQGVPLCQSFCDGWFEACRSDRVCVRNFLTDWRVDETGNHCRNDCIPYDQMYMNSTDLCQNIAGGSFVVSASPCQCLDMTPTDQKVIKYILKNTHSEESEEESEEEKACKLRLQRAPGKKKP